MKLMKVNNNHWLALLDDRQIAGTLEAVKFALRSIACISEEEIAFALAEFDRLGHNVADFGVLGRLCYTSKHAVGWQQAAA